MSAQPRSGSLDAYFAEASEWDRDRRDGLRREVRIAWCITIGAVICAIAASVALLLAMPLKRVDPFLIRVDRSSGVVDVVPIFAGEAPLDESVTRYFLTHYVSVCERFNFSTAESDYEECGAFHSAQRNQSWYALWNRSNPRSPLNVHRDGSAVEAQVSAVSFFTRASGISDTAQVRYLKLERAAPGAPERITHWIATIQYAYTTPATDPKVRRWNPLGFRVLDFISEAEVTGEIAASPSPKSEVAP
ncbi:MAG TPA: type IV secretion system protein [Steroidobacteraceae bacterium]|nr:type IV secretion system protein [Steroidobacteraceae bacterium]